MTSPPWLARMVVGGVLVWGCSAHKDADPGSGHGGGGGAGSETGAAGTSGAGGPGGAGTTGAGGATGGSTGAAMVVCAGNTLDNNTPGAIANPADFSTNSATGMNDQHTLWMGRADMYRRVKTYVTAGPADHKHELTFTDADLDFLLSGKGDIFANTNGPPLNASTGHTHLVTVRGCGGTPGSGGSGGAGGSGGSGGA